MLPIGTKTVYDPTVVSEQSVKELGYRIFKEGMEDLQYFSGSNQKKFEVQIGGKKFIGFMDLNGVIKSWYLQI